MNQMAPMHVKTAREVPEYEINPDELDFTQSKGITKVKEYVLVSNESFIDVFSINFSLTV